MNDDERQPWDRLVDHAGPLGPEDQEWFARFLHYMNQPHPRSFRTTYEAFGLGSDKDPYKVSSAWRERINEYRWSERAGAYDVDQQKARKTEHRATMDDVVDTLFDGAVRAAETLVGYATDRRRLGKDPRQDRIRLQAAESVLDRLGIVRRSPRPLYPEHDDDTDTVLEVRLVGMDQGQLEALAAWDDEDPTDYQ